MVRIAILAPLIPNVHRITLQSSSTMTILDDKNAMAIRWWIYRTVKSPSVPEVRQREQKLLDKEIAVSRDPAYPMLIALRTRESPFTYQWTK